MQHADYTAQAEALFQRFAARHDLIYEIETSAPVEVLWTFPAQPKLSLPLTLGLQNGDELNFGVASFWSYFFPFREVEVAFEAMLDRWVEGHARILVHGFLGGQTLEVWEDNYWRTRYRADRFFTFGRRPKAIVQNAPSDLIG